MEVIFKKGDRVRAKQGIGDDMIVKGDIGTIIEYDDIDSMCVEWERNIGGHSRGGNGKLGHCWWVDGVILELVGEAL